MTSVDTECKFLGIDFFFRQYNKLFVKEVLSLQTQNKGLYEHHGHILYKVEIQGIIVKVSENRKCFILTVDDSTGEIVCCIWKNNIFKNKGVLQIEELPQALQQRARRLNAVCEEENMPYVIGDMVTIRGKVTEFREQREIIVTNHYKVTDPNAEVLHLCYLPLLHKKNYDHPFVLPKVFQQAQVQGPGSSFLAIDDLADPVYHKILPHLQSNLKSEINVEEISQIDGLMAFIQKGQAVDTIGPWSLHCWYHIYIGRVAFNKLLLHSQPENALETVAKVMVTIEKQGLVCCPQQGSTMVYEFLELECLTGLDKAVLEVLSLARKNKKYEELGCHVYHILGELHRTKQYSQVSLACVNTVLDKLERSSDIIRSTQSHYILCSM